MKYSLPNPFDNVGKKVPVKRKLNLRKRRKRLDCSFKCAILLRLKQARGNRKMAKYTAKREWGNTPNGNEINGRWVVRNQNNKFVEVEKYSNDLRCKYKDTLIFKD